MPPGRRLDWDLRDGWAPLCAFLGKPVPDVPFPRANPREAHLARVRQRQDKFLRMVVGLGVRKAVPWAVGLVAVAVGYGALRRPGVFRGLVDKARQVVLYKWKLVR